MILSVELGDPGPATLRGLQLKKKPTFKELLLCNRANKGLEMRPDILSLLFYLFALTPNFFWQKLSEQLLDSKQFLLRNLWGILD